MKSVRLDQALEARLDEASRLTRKSVSVLIREAIERECDTILRERLDHRLADVIGVVRSRGGRARDTGKAFRKSLRSKQSRSAA